MALTDAFKLSIDVQLGALELVSWTPVLVKTQIFISPTWGSKSRKHLSLPKCLRSNCRIPCHFKVASLKSTDTWIGSGEDHPFPRNNLSVVWLWIAYADMWIPSGEDQTSPRNNLRWLKTVFWFLETYRTRRDFSGLEVFCLECLFYFFKIILHCSFHGV